MSRRVRVGDGHGHGETPRPDPEVRTSKLRRRSRLRGQCSLLVAILIPGRWRLRLRGSEEKRREETKYACIPSHLSQYSRDTLVTPCSMCTKMCISPSACGCGCKTS